ncbi:MFS transporter [Alicyclobacillus acidocaldarius]|uniref:Major facilitator superfamily MFS_1 n=1 Tax=Alicyclobacillus acidocaldarius subsp. acidocaldarius (strain ATCC 27009 / DSM 446 / BCRC 14685 / JCM 5260 / KCTC 1825 / NBRC 15652 / NCIMB 11725 / NRRL B-14509 / 104-IA) TaxID=521098 RepID=C8WTA0_ALIAD|nr:MFS transporter [Alicyclobacillus acidocaldarius]ACV59614.1 major facilitator superfamily MFS_1 [Alicyclobacillus acidocaldarius subsp. acidocaldarius DSM 446]
MRRPAWLGILAASLIPFVLTLGNSMMVPVVPVMQSTFGVTPTAASLLITAYSVIAVVLMPVAGFLSDRMSRRRLAIAALAVAAAGGGVAALGASAAHSYAWVLLGRIVQGVGAAFSMPLALPLASDLADPHGRGRAAGFTEVGNTVGKLMSPILGALLATWAFFAPFWAVFALCGTLSATIAWMVPERRAPVPRSHLPAAWRLAFRAHAKLLTATYLSGAVSMLCLFGGLVSLSESLADSAHVPEWQNGLLLSIPQAMLCLASLVTGLFSDRWKAPSRAAIALGLAWTAASFGAASASQDMAWQIAAVSLGAYGIGTAITAIDASLATALSHEVRGTLSSLYTSARFLGPTLGPPLASWLQGFGARTPYAVLSAIALAAAIAIAPLLRRSTQDGESAAREQRQAAHT